MRREAVLRRSSGGAEVRREQLDYVQGHTSPRNVTLQIMSPGCAARWSSGRHTLTAFFRGTVHMVETERHQPHGGQVNQVPVAGGTGGFGLHMRAGFESRAALRSCSAR
ncbi:Scr1 family TA system antitoxin-like transcriptional regulator [Streptomyces sp. H28]|uniref:Scr1 family TA system antitoxin-like transcriptional regulator n=1 Tax=Streptomyces sp. H28 TaxID=2775865 RepID=UPI00298CAF17|nr:Scr1 family TA system antitoxin-like transcriptional regulator [Streptomyces sp. H28]